MESRLTKRNANRHQPCTVVDCRFLPTELPDCCVTFEPYRTCRTQAEVVGGIVFAGEEGVTEDRLWR